MNQPLLSGSSRSETSASGIRVAGSTIQGEASQITGMSAEQIGGLTSDQTAKLTATQIAAEQMTVDLAATTDENLKAAKQKQIDEWKKAAARYRSEPEAAGGKGEGTAELSRRAIDQQHHRDNWLAKYHHYELASAAFQIGIVLASATVITGIVALTVLAGGLGIIGLGFMAVGLFAPHAIHLL